MGMGELAVTADAGAVLTTIGLGSCVAVALLDSASDAVGLAHVIFPKAPARAVAEHGKYADTAVPALIAALGRLGSPRTRLVAVLAGGARMFSFERALDLDIGKHNLIAVGAALADSEIPVRAERTRGSTGRSVRVDARGGVVSISQRGRDHELYRVPKMRLASGAAG